MLIGLERLNFAVIGLGVMGKRRVKTILESKSANLSAVYDIDRKLAERFAKMNNCRWATELDEIFRDHSIDVVIVSVPNKFHSSIVISALESGKHVLCEKPMATYPEEASAMVRAAEAQKLFLKVGSNHRYFPNVMKAKELIKSGTLGRPIVFRGWIGHDGSKFGSEWFKNYDIVGGGTLLDNGCHIIDIARMLIGEPKYCFGETDNLLRDDIKPAEDYASVIYRTVNGGLISLNCSWIEWYGYLYFEVFGEKGFVIVDARYGNRLTWGLKGAECLEISDFTNKPQQSYNIELDLFIDAIRNGHEPEPSGHDGARVVEMIHAAYMSSKTGVRVKL